ncbi:PadR family transcriptional regulator [Actinopolymorpha pittospori]
MGQRSMTEDRWPASWLRGVLEVAVLAALVDGESYGYALAQRLSRAGLGKVSGNTLYPVLARLEASGAVSSRWTEGDGGPGRKFYAITKSGRQRLATDGEDWERFASATITLVSEARTNSGGNRSDGTRT